MVLCGFTIIDPSGYEEEVRNFILARTFVKSSDIADNIISAGRNINVFTQKVTLEDLDAVPFPVAPITLDDGETLLVSIVNFMVELDLGGSSHRLEPSGYLRVPTRMEGDFTTYVKQGLIKMLSSNGEGIRWILSGGVWKDLDYWIDSKYWED